MSTIHDAASTVNFDQALLKAASRAKDAYPFERLAVERGLQIALADGVVLLADGTAQVRSQSQPDVWYSVNGACPCKATVANCAHRWAKSLAKWAHKLVQQTTPPRRYYASYYGPDGEMRQGVALYTDRGWLFCGEQGEEPLYVSIHALCLGGRLDLLEAQRTDDGDLVAKVCNGHAGMVTK